MKNVREKSRIILGPYFVIAIVFPIVYIFLRWLFQIRLRWLVANEAFMEFILPGMLLLFLVVLLLRRRFKIMKSDRGTLGFIMMAVISIMTPTLFGQYYITKAGYKLNKLKTVSNAADLASERYFSIQVVGVDTAARLQYFRTTRTGKQQQNLDLDLFVVAPMLDTFRQGDSTMPTAWYTRVYRKTIDNTLDLWDKSDLFKQFLAQSDSAWRQELLKAPKYFENLPLDFERRGAEDAIAKRFSVEGREMVLLSPQYEAFEKRTGRSSLWFFLSWTVGTGLFTLIILFMKLSHMELYRYERGEPPQEDSLKWIKEFLTPKNPQFTTAVLIHVTWIYFALYSLTGVDFIDPYGSELIPFGAKSRELVVNGQYWRLFSSIFVHSGFYHLGYNLFALGVAGYLLERFLGRWKMLVVYVLTGLVASICSVLYYEDAVSCGASGAIFGLFGTSLGLLLTKALPPAARLTHGIVLVLYAGISFLIGFITPGVGNAAHVAGLSMGILIGVFLGGFSLLRQPKNLFGINEEEDDSEERDL